MKTWLHVVLVGMILVLFSNIAAALVTVRGLSSCGAWVEAREKDRKQNTTLNVANQIWLVGYLSGMAMATDKNFWGNEGVNLLDNESVALWMDNFCRANPLKDMATGGYLLFIERTRNK